MNIPILGGIEIQGVSKKENSICVECVLKTPQNDIENETEIEFTLNSMKNKKDFNRFLKKDINNKIKNFLDRFNITKFDFENGKNQTTISFKLDKIEYKDIVIDWQYTKDQLSIPAPYVSGDFIIDTRIFNNKVFNTYYNYLLLSNDIQSNIIGQTNLLLFFESIESQRNMSILNLLISLHTLIEAYRSKGETLFSLNSSSFDKDNINVTYNYKVNRNMQTECNIFLKNKNSVYEIHNKDGFNKEALYSFYMNFYDKEKMSIVEFDITKETNKKHFENNISIFNENKLLFSFQENEISNLLLSLDNILLNEKMEIIEIITPQEKIEEIINKILNAI